MEVILLASVTVSQSEADRLQLVLKEQRELMRDVPGWISTTLWLQAGQAGSHLVMGRFRDIESAELGLRKLVESESFLQAVSDLAAPPDLHRVKVIRKAGKIGEEVEIGKFLSLSSRIADPGMGDRLLDELELIFEGIRSMPGVLGTVEALDETNEDNVFGLAFWEDSQAFDGSLPDHMMYEVLLYRREA